MEQDTALVWRGVQSSGDLHGRSREVAKNGGVGLEGL